MVEVVGDDVFRTFPQEPHDTPGLRFVTTEGAELRHATIACQQAMRWRQMETPDSFDRKIPGSIRAVEWPLGREVVERRYSRQSVQRRRDGLAGRDVVRVSVHTVGRKGHDDGGVQTSHTHAYGADDRIVVLGDEAIREVENLGIDYAERPYGGPQLGLTDGREFGRLTHPKRAPGAASRERQGRDRLASGGRGANETTRVQGLVVWMGSNHQQVDHRQSIVPPQLRFARPAYLPLGRTIVARVWTG